MDVYLRIYDQYGTDVQLSVVPLDDLMSWKLSDESFTAIDYFKSKGRTLKVKIRNYAWFEDNVMSYSTGMFDWDLKVRDYAKFRFKLCMGDGTDCRFEGYLRNSSIKKMYEQDAGGNDISTVEFVLYDLLTIMNDMLSREIEVNANEFYPIAEIFATALEKTLIDSSITINAQNVGDLYNADLSYSISIMEGTETIQSLP